MNRTRTQLTVLLTPLLAALLLPVKLASLLLHHQAGRLRAARLTGDRGAISIELALIIVALVVIAIGVTAALSILGGHVTTQVSNLPVK